MQTNDLPRVEEPFEWHDRSMSPTLRIARPAEHPDQVGTSGDPAWESDEREPAFIDGHAALPQGTMLGEFKIIRVLGSGGFGVVYLALDQALLRYVAIKEFMPTSLAGRTASGGVAPRSVADAKTFGLGLESFFNEGRLLARFDHPSLVKVFRFWKGNGTAYMAMQYYAGQTLKEARSAMLEPPDEAWLRALVAPMLDALDVLHAEGVFHRDIAPDNILLLPDGRPVILDFGSARRVIADQTQSLTAILKPNFSPVEQYADDAGMRQGPYTDLYALGGTVYFMLTGEAPAPSVMRAVRDSLPVLGAEPAERFPHVTPTFLRTIDWALAVDPSLRPQTAESLRSALNGNLLAPPPTTRQASTQPPADKLDHDRPVATQAPAAIIGDPYEPTIRAPRREPSSNAQAPAVVPRRRNPLRTGLVAATLGAVVLGALAFARMGGSPGQASSTPPFAEVGAQRPMPPAGKPMPLETAAKASVVSTPSAQESARDSMPQVERGTERRKTATAPQSAPSSEVPAKHPKQTVALAPALAVASGGRGAQTGAAPSELCTGMNFFASAACLSRNCEAPQLKSHPQCVEARRIVEQRQRRMDQ